MKPQVDELQSQAKEWAIKVHDGWMDQQKCLRMMIWPSISYPLPVCSMSRAQGDAIIVKLYQAMLPELSLQKQFPRIWRYQGLALLHPYSTQGVKSVAVFQQAGLCKDLRGCLLRANMEQAQLEIGTSQLVLRESFSEWGFLLMEHCWICSLWRFCSEFAITLEAEHLQAPGPQRQNNA
jgi:hypothetical protein